MRGQTCDDAPDGRDLLAVGVFAGLSQAELAEIAVRMHTRCCAAGELLFQEGDPGDELFVLLSGAIRISLRPAEGREITLSEVAAGGFFGEMSIIERVPRSATCRATAESVLLALHADDFDGLARSRPDIAASVMRRMLAIAAGRLLDTGSLLSQMVQWGEGARRRAITDEATGLYNRRFLDDSLEGLFSRSRLEGSPFSIAMFDLDHFGDLNRSYGTAYGDKVIVDASRVFRKVFRKSDLLVRYGGDEFTFVLPGTGSGEAVALCGELCREIRALSFDDHPELRLSASLGVAAWPEHAQALEGLREAADRALYKAKELGRDRAERP